jgi:diaminopimelate dehydrogenase
MENKLKIGIIGYGNLGKGVEMAVKQNADIELVAIFTRRDTTKIKGSSIIVPVSRIEEYIGKIDVMILCGGSATDLPIQGPHFSKTFNTIDSFDTHAKIPEYFEKNIK